MLIVTKGMNQIVGLLSTVNKCFVTKWRQRRRAMLVRVADFRHAGVTVADFSTADSRVADFASATRISGSRILFQRRGFQGRGF